jgi:hypothetical protein
MPPIPRQQIPTTNKRGNHPRREPTELNSRHTNWTRSARWLHNYIRLQPRRFGCHPTQEFSSRPSSRPAQTPKGPRCLDRGFPPNPALFDRGVAHFRTIEKQPRPLRAALGVEQQHETNRLSDRRALHPWQHGHHLAAADRLAMRGNARLRGETGRVALEVPRSHELLRALPGEPSGAKARVRSQRLM